MCSTCAAAAVLTMASTEHCCSSCVCVCEREAKRACDACVYMCVFMHLHDACVCLLACVCVFVCAFASGPVSWVSTPPPPTHTRAHTHTHTPKTDGFESLATLLLIYLRWALWELMYLTFNDNSRRFVALFTFQHIPAVHTAAYWKTSIFPPCWKENTHTWRHTHTHTHGRLWTSRCRRLLAVADDSSKTLT